MSFAIKQNFKISPRLSLKIKRAEILELSEGELSEYIKKIENDDIFKKLISKKVITKRSFPSIKTLRKTVSLNEEILKDNNSFDIFSLLSKNEEIVDVAKKIGYESFKKLLFSEDKIDLIEIQKKYNLSNFEIKVLYDFLFNFIIEKTFFSQTYNLLPKKSEIVAVVDPYNKKIEFTNENSSGLYIIDFEKLSNLKQKMDDKEKDRTNQLVNILNAINIKNNLLLKIIKKIIETNEKYFYTKKIYYIAPLSIRKIAKDLNISPSTVSRCIKNKKILFPDGEEREIKFFFKHKKEIVMNFIKEFKNYFYGKELKEKIFKELNIFLEDRTFYYYMKKLKDEK